MQKKPCKENRSWSSSKWENPHPNTNLFIQSVLQLKWTQNPRNWTDELRLSSPHGAFCLWIGHVVTEQSACAPLPGKPTPTFTLLLWAGRGSPYLTAAGSAANGLPQFPFCLLHFWLTQQIHRRSLQHRESQRLETKKVYWLFIYLFAFLPSHDQGFRGARTWESIGINQFAISSELIEHCEMGNKSLWRTNPSWKRATAFVQSTVIQESLTEIWCLISVQPSGLYSNSLSSMCFIMVL